MKVSQGKEDGVPVRLFRDKSSQAKFANWSNSAGMGPGVYKTQSKHTKIKSSHRTVRFDLGTQAYALILKASKGEEKWSGINTGTPISPIDPIQPEWDMGYTKPSQKIQKTSHAIVLVQFD